MNCCRHKYFVIYRGDDTDFPGNQELIIELNTTRDLTGCKAHFSFQGFTQDFTEIPSDKKLRLVIPNSATGKFALGAADAKLWLTNGTKVRTVENRIHIVVTNRVDEAYDNDDPQAITVTISGGGGGATVVLDDTVTEESTNGVKSSGIWSWVKSLLPSWLTAESEEPRGKTDFDVQPVVLGYVISTEVAELSCHKKVSATKWVGNEEPTPSIQRGVVEFNANGVGVHVYREWFNGEGWVFDIDFGSNETAKPTDKTFATTGGLYDSTVTTEFSANQKLARTANLTAGGLAKFGDDGVLEKATEDVDYLKTHQDISGKQDKILETGVLKGGGAGAILPAMPSSSAGETADYRDPADNTCHKTTSVAGEWSTVTKDGDVWSVYCWETSCLSECVLQLNGRNYPNSSTKVVEDDTATSLTWVKIVDWDKDFDITFTRTFTTLASKDHTFVTEDVMSDRLGPYAKSDSVAPSFDDTKTYAVDEVVMHGGSLYRCTTAVTTAGAWNDANWTPDTATHGDTAFLKDEQGHLVIRETEGKDGEQPQTLYVDAYRLAQDTTTHVIRDAAINEIGEMAAGVTLALPPAIAGHSRDFVVELKIGATVPAFVFPLAETDLKPYSDEIPTWAANTIYCISFTEFPDGKWCLGVRSKEVTP